jgi:hypothetical protein
VEDIHDIAKRTADRIDALLHASGRYVEAEQAGAEAEQNMFTEQPLLSSCYQAAAAGLELMGERAGQPTLRLVGEPTANAATSSAALCAQVRGVNVHARARADRDRPS